MKPIKIGLLGLGTVGHAVLTVLARNSEEIRRRAGRSIEVVMVASRNAEEAAQKLAKIPNMKFQWTYDVHQILQHPEIDVIVELIGGVQLAREWIMTAIQHGKHVVTANKAVLAIHGNEIFAAAQAKGVMIAFEAAVGGGVPIIKTLREGLSANHILSVAGIINGTTNYILSHMQEKEVDFEFALRQAQSLGYAEADPRFDIEGIDAAHKISILSAIAFGVPVQFSKVYVEGITRVTLRDIHYAEHFGYRIKLLAIAKRTKVGNSAAIELRVHPTLIPNKCLLANVYGAMNAVLIQGDVVGATMYYGKGAGGEPTASAVIADLVDVARLDSADPGHRVPYLAFQADALVDVPVLPISEVSTSYYLRLRVMDKPGVLAEITRLLSLHTISIDAMNQHEAIEGEQQTEVVILTHQTPEKRILQALAEIQLLPTVLAPVIKIRVETLA